MSVTANILVRHDFFELDNYEKSEKFVKQAIDHVKHVLSIDEDYDHFHYWGYYDEDNKWSDIQFDIPLLDLSVHLKPGYWCIWTRSNYCQVTNKLNGRLHIADDAFDTSRALGQNDAWICDEFVEQEFEENTLDEILTAASERWGITEYPYTELMKNSDNAFPEPARFYHYDFAEIATEFDELRERCGECTPTIINHISRSFVRVVKNGKINLLDADLKPVFERGLDNIFMIEGREFVCRQGGKIALFGDGAKQLTDFVVGKFDWEWPDSYYDNLNKICYLNEKAKLKVMATYTEGGGVEYASLPYSSILIKRKPTKCTACGGKVVPIVYGCPSSEIFHKADCKEVILGGCCITVDDNGRSMMPDWECIECHTKYIKG